MKYIDAEKLIAEIRIIQQSLESRDVRFNQVKEIRTKCSLEFCKCIIDVITSLQQEQPDVDLDKEIKDTCREYRINDYHEQELGKHDIENIARYFYELGLNARGK